MCDRGHNTLGDFACSSGFVRLLVKSNCAHQFVLCAHEFVLCAHEFVLCAHQLCVHIMYVYIFFPVVFHDCYVFPSVRMSFPPFVCRGLYTIDEARYHIWVTNSYVTNSYKLVTNSYIQNLHTEWCEQLCARKLTRVHLCCRVSRQLTCAHNNFRVCTPIGVCKHLCAHPLTFVHTYWCCKHLRAHLLTCVRTHWCVATLGEI